MVNLCHFVRAGVSEAGLEKDSWMSDKREISTDQHHKIDLGNLIRKVKRIALS